MRICEWVCSGIVVQGLIFLYQKWIWMSRLSEVKFTAMFRQRKCWLHVFNCRIWALWSWSFGDIMSQRYLMGRTKAEVNVLSYCRRRFGSFRGVSCFDCWPNKDKGKGWFNSHHLFFFFLIWFWDSGTNEYNSPRSATSMDHPCTYQAF